MGILFDRLREGGGASGAGGGVGIMTGDATPSSSITMMDEGGVERGSFPKGRVGSVLGHAFPQGFPGVAATAAMVKTGR